MLKSSSAKTESLDILEDSGYSPQGDDGQEGQRALEQQEVIAALRKIDERYRLPLFLKYYEGYTAAEIAHTLQIPENTVYTNISRGKAQLKGVLSHGR
jgi:RNA polymerase sigma-70 factor (ECF subfamily)